MITTTSIILFTLGIIIGIIIGKLLAEWGDEDEDEEDDDFDIDVCTCTPKDREFCHLYHTERCSGEKGSKAV